MKKLTLTVAGVLALATLPATAADLRPAAKAPVAPVVAPFNWSGFYIGINGGGGWGRSRHSFPLTGLSTGDFNVDGGLIGGTIGANFQTGAFVFGLEGDLDWSGIKGSTACPNPAFTCETDNRWLGTVRGRIGYAMGTVMPYVTGGLAVGDIRMRTISFGSETETKAGWTLGAGLEFALNPSWSIKGEYLYVDLGTATCGTGICGVGADDVRFRAHVLRAGINHRFNIGGPVVASY